MILVYLGMGKKALTGIWSPVNCNYSKHVSTREPTSPTASDDTHRQTKIRANDSDEGRSLGIPSER